MIYMKVNFFYNVQELFYNKFEHRIMSDFIKKAKLNDEEKERLSNSEKPYLELQKLIYETAPL